MELLSAIRSSEPIPKRRQSAETPAESNGRDEVDPKQEVHGQAGRI